MLRPVEVKFTRFFRVRNSQLHAIFLGTLTQLSYLFLLCLFILELSIDNDELFYLSVSVGFLIIVKFYLSVSVYFLIIPEPHCLRTLRLYVVQRTPVYKKNCIFAL